MYKKNTIFNLPKIAKRQYIVQVKAKSKLEYFVGENSECRMVELYSDFSVNNVSGWGVAEWQNRHIKG